MSPPVRAVGNNSANYQQKPLAKYIGDLDSAGTFTCNPRLNQRRNIDVDPRFRLFGEVIISIRWRSDAEEIPFPNKEEHKDVSIPVEILQAEEIGDLGDPNGFCLKGKSSPKAVGGTGNEKTTCNNGCAKECVAPGPANPGLAISTLHDHPGGGGGGGGGGDESDEDHRAQKKYDDHGKKVQKKRKQKKNKRSSDTHVEMQVSMAEGQQDQPEQNPQNAAKVMRLRERQKWHTRINRYNFCKCANKCCENCKQTNEEIRGYFEEGNLDWAPVVEYHRKICQFQYRCELCSRYKEKELLAIKNIGQLKKRSTEDLIIWRNDIFDELNYFEEWKHFCFEDDRYFAKGGFGEVHHIELPISLKEKYFGSSYPRLVLKKAIVKTDEMYVLTQTATHPNFVKTLLVVQKKEKKFTHRIIMEKCEMSMKDFLKQLWKDGKALEKGEALFYWHQVVDAVVFLHSLRVIHKDIKAANVLLTISDNMIRVKLADFGLVKFLPDEYTKSGLPAAGTPGFMAPEVRKRRAHGRPADIYSLGMLLLQLLFEDWKNVQKALQDLKNLDEDLGSLVERCLDENPQRRPTAVEIRDAVAKNMKMVDLSEAKDRLSSQ